MVSPIKLRNHGPAPRLRSTPELPRVWETSAKVYPTARAFTRNPQVRLRRRFCAHRVDCACVSVVASNQPTHVWSVGSIDKCWGEKETILALLLTICTPTFDKEPSKIRRSLGGYCKIPLNFTLLSKPCT